MSVTRKHANPKYLITSILFSVLLLTGIRSTVVSAAESEKAAFDATQHMGKLAFEDNFNVDTLDITKWVLTKQNDFEESTIDLTKVKQDEDEKNPDTEKHLRLRASTMGTDDKTVKYHGIRSLNPIVNLQQPVEINFDLDWNKQANGCYLTAGVKICPTATTENPDDQSDCLAIEYIGVPPGENARLWIAVEHAGYIKQIVYAEGWPTEQRVGRKIGLQHVRIVLTKDMIKLWEGDKLLCEGKFQSSDKIATPLNWDNAYLYLQQSSHNNYRAREIYFDNVKVQPVQQ